VTAYAASRAGVLESIGHGFSNYEGTLSSAIVVAVLGLGLVFGGSHFNVMMITTVLIFAIACLGLNIQFGYAGVLNFAGASFLGVGGYTAAVLTLNTALPGLLIILLGGVLAAIIGSILIIP